MLSTHLSIIDSIDKRVWEFFVENPTLTGLAKFITQFGVSSVLLPLSAVVGVMVWRSSRSAYHSMLPFVSVYVATVVISSLKDWSDVPRPPRDMWLVTASSASFPSGHVGSTTAFLTAVFIVVSREFPMRRNATLWGAVAGSVVMGWTRLALNVHWLSDVIGGLVVGVAVTFAVTRIFDGVRSRRENPLRTPGAPGD
jgi:membrane-associated phospholipid phosphatase